MEIKEIIRALRCSSTVGSECIKEECPYFIMIPKEEQKDFMAKHGITNVPEGFWEDCDCTKSALDGASILEALVKEKDFYRWHNLEEYPADLPEEWEKVLVHFEYFRYGDYNKIVDDYGISYQYNDRFAFVNGTCGWSKLRILAWRYIPKE